MTQRSSYGKVLQQRRRRLQLTQAQLGRLAGCSAAMIRKIEADLRQPSAELEQALARALDGMEQDQGLSRRAADPPTASRTPEARLPLAATPLIGREREQAALRALLMRQAVRLVTLTGVGGVGKTRLALAVAADIAPAFASGAAFVGLAPVREPEQVLPLIAQSFGVADDGSPTLLRKLQHELREARALLVLDNCEQVLAAADEVATLLRSVPGLTILATSREPLHLQGEHEFALQPLPLPEAHERAAYASIAQSAAVQLFTARAQAVSHVFALTPDNAADVAFICARLDGLPLAIELAAARVKLLPLPSLRGRLSQRLALLTGGARDAPERHQTLRAAIAWSDELLAPAEQDGLRRLAVFVDGWSLPAAEAVIDGDTGLPALDLLHSLLDKSLIYRDDRAAAPRYRMLETIREYAFEQLAAAGAAAVQVRHAAFFHGLAEQGAAELAGSAQAEWAAALEAEHANLRAALGWTREHGTPEAALRLTTALARFWWMRGHLREGRQALAHALARGGDCAPLLRARALYWLGILALHLDDYAGAEEALAESLALAEQTRDQPAIGNALNALGLTANRRGDPAAARARYAEALALYRALDDGERIATLLNNLGFTALLQGDLPAAEALLGESLELARAQGDSHGIAFALNNLGRVGLRRGNLGAAADQLSASLALFRTLGDQRSAAECLEACAAIALERASPELAVRLLGAAEALRAAVGAPVPSFERTDYAALIARVRAALPEQAFDTAWLAGQRLSLDEAVGAAGALAGEQPDPGG